MTTNDLSRIAGIIYPDVLQVENLLPSMLTVMGQGLKKEIDTYEFKNFQLGSIGKKIGSNTKKTILCSLDGFIENSQDLLKDLKEHGYPEPKTSEELIINTYEIYQEKFLEKLDGSFALMLLDQEKETLTLARDRIGKKPLYWYHDNHHFIFASELKGMLKSGLVPQTFSEEALAMYLYFGFIPQDLSPIKDVNKLLPAHYLCFNTSQGKFIRSYWSYACYFEKKQNSELSHVKETLNKLLSKSIEKLSDGKQMGCFISGGLGSATIAYELSQKNQPIGFTAGFKDQNDADVKAAKEVAEALHLEQKIVEIEASHFTDDLIDIVWSLDEPLADPNIIATWNIAKLAKENVSEVYSGMGSDELLAGHSRYTLTEQTFTTLNRLSMIPSPIIKHVIVPLCNKIYKPAALSILKISRTNPWQFEFLRHNAVFDENELREAAPKISHLFDPDTFLHKFHNLSKIKSTVSTLQYFDVKSRLPDSYILQYDRLTKAHGLVWQTPFLDRHIVEYTAGLKEPEVLEECETASYLKPLLEKILPDSFLNRPKRTRKNFLADWAVDPKVKKLFPLLLTGTLVESDIISVKWLKNCLENDEALKTNFRMLWACLVLEIWFQLYINRPIELRPRIQNLYELIKTA